MNQRGAPEGNQNAKKGRDWTAAIRAAVMEIDPATKREKLHGIAQKLAALALDGDIQAIKEIGDRLEGKPAQAITGGDGGAVAFEVIRRIIVDPKA